MKSLVSKATLLLVSVLLALVIAEVVLRFIYPADVKYYVWQPNLEHTFHPDSTIFYGIRGEKHFSINDFGVRGEVFKGDTKELNPSIYVEVNKQNYLCIGGSTTECLYLDDTETWWYCLQQAWRHTNKNIVVASIGKSGCTTRENYIQLKYVVPQLKNVTGVIFMVGLNDLMKRLSRDTLFENNFRFTPAIEDSLARTILLRQGRNQGNTWWRRTALYYGLSNLYHRKNPKGVAWQIEDDRGESLRKWRLNRHDASCVIDTLPDLTSALDEYERNLQLIYNEAKHQHLEVIFIEQVAMYKDTMSSYENSLLWMGGIGNFQNESGHAYYSTGALRRGLDAYNQRLQKFCGQNHVKLVKGLGDSFPRDTSAFYDDCHFNENGARLLGSIIANAKFD